MNKPQPAPYGHYNYCSTFEDFDKATSSKREEQYAILEFGSVYIPGDQRSVDYPGHGYPSRNESTCKIIVYADRATWEQEIRYRTQGMLSTSRQWAPIVFRRPTITTLIAVDVPEIEERPSCVIS